MITPLRLNGPLRQSARAGGARETAATAGSFTQAGAADAASSRGTSAPAQPVASLATLVAIQASEDSATAWRRALRRGVAILDDLDALKLAILEGRAGQSELEQIARKIASAREASGDEGLESLVDAIELRAQVEIAKRQR